MNLTEAEMLAAFIEIDDAKLDLEAVRIAVTRSYSALATSQQAATPEHRAALDAARSHYLELLLATMTPEQRHADQQARAERTRLDLPKRLTFMRDRLDRLTLLLVGALDSPSRR